MSDYSELKRLAEAATPGPWSFDSAVSCLVSAESNKSTICELGFQLGSADYHNLMFIAAANPVAVLALIADAERNQRMLIAACSGLGAIGNALNADMNSDGEELLSLVWQLEAVVVGLKKKELIMLLLLFLSYFLNKKRKHQTLTLVFNQLFSLVNLLNDVRSSTDTSRHGAATSPRNLFKIVLPLASLIALADIFNFDR